MPDSHETVSRNPGAIQVRFLFTVLVHREDFIVLQTVTDVVDFAALIIICFEWTES